MSSWRGVRVVVAMLALAGAGLVFAPAPGGADIQDEIEKQTFWLRVFSRPGCEAEYFDRTHDGHIHVYVGYDPADGGTNCVFAVRSRGAADEPEFFELDVHRCDEDAVAWADGCESDPPASGDGVTGAGAYSYLYAGPVFITEMDGRCLQVTTGYDDWSNGGQDIRVSESTRVGRCA
jgi:hypothetical protein